MAMGAMPVAATPAAEVRIFTYWGKKTKKTEA